MADLAEKRVYDRRAETQFVYAASGMGVTVVETSGDSVGRFRLVRECEAHDLAGGGGWLAVATPDDVLARAVGGSDEGDDEWIETGFGPATAVGVDEGDLLAASPDGELGRVVDVDDDPTEWFEVADVDGAVRALDGPLVGASDGVYRFTPDGIVDVGLDDVRDVSAAGVPLAATGDGLFRLGNGWLRELDGPVDVVAGTDRAAEGSERPDATGGNDRPGSDALARGHAAAGEQFYEYRGESADAPADGDHGAGDPAATARTWRERATPAAPVVAVAYGERTYALAGDGTFLLDRGAEWASQPLGLPGPTALATPE